jgi:hypothetical protein
MGRSLQPDRFAESDSTHRAPVKSHLHFEQNAAFDSGDCLGTIVAILKATLEDPHHEYERKQVIWLFISFALIGLMVVAVMLYGALQAGLWKQGQ